MDCGLSLHYTSDRLKNNDDIVLKAVKKYGCSLECTSQRLQNDNEIVTAAILQDGGALYYVSEKLKNNDEIILKSINNNCGALVFANERFKRNRKLFYFVHQKRKSEDDITNYDFEQVNPKIFDYKFRIEEYEIKSFRMCILIFF